MSQGNQQPPSAPLADRELIRVSRDMFQQLQRTQQWEADGTHLLRPAAFHAWAAAGWAQEAQAPGQST